MARDRNPRPPPSAGFASAARSSRSTTKTVRSATRASRANPTTIFFGFTFCPEVCPTPDGDDLAALASLGIAADKLNVVFVSVDPERDMPAQMKLYPLQLRAAHQGFTGTVDQVDASAKAYRVYHQKVP